MTDARIDPKPAHWSPAYARQFEDESVASAYHTRPPYPPELFELLAGLFPPGERRMLDLGCGTGDIALGMLGKADRIDAVDPSRAMLRIAAGREGAAHAGLRWSCAMAEEFDFGARYSLVVAAESVHWMEWDVVLPRISRALVPGGFFAIVSGRSLLNVPWSAELAELIPRFSTNREYRRQDEVAELKRRGSFDEVGRRTLSPAVQPIRGRLRGVVPHAKWVFEATDDLGVCGGVRSRAAAGPLATLPAWNRPGRRRHPGRLGCAP